MHPSENNVENLELLTMIYVQAHVSVCCFCACVQVPTEVRCWPSAAGVTAWVLAPEPAVKGQGRALHH